MVNTGISPIDCGRL